MKGDQPWFAIRVAIKREDGSSVQRDYVRGQKHVGMNAFVAFAIGDLLMLVDALDEQVSVHVEEVDLIQVQQNRRYNHTTHTE